MSVMETNICFSTQCIPMDHCTKMLTIFLGNSASFSTSISLLFVCLFVFFLSIVFGLHYSEAAKCYEEI
ncbi:hypothetical protein FWK35_00004895 [Aphis craccivora]|uniref:Uncharacterized protein n=1 Tax=Aphis craccivora TaxID=307492 RepID=A0A6G0YTH4_APHCR|nr:hypothetical protein FWK35_00004895 [Aphis craccivora]